MNLMDSRDNFEHTPWNYMSSLSSDEFSWEEENEARLWYCPHGKAYAIRCRPCENDND